VIDRIETEDLTTVLRDLGADISDEVAEAVSRVCNDKLFTITLAGFQPLQGDRASLEVLAAMLLSFLKEIEGIDVARVLELHHTFSLLWNLDRVGCETGFHGPTPKA
jgi:hypothetical protein